MDLKRLVVLILLLLGASTLALVGTATANMAVSANIPQICIITSTALNFGEHDPIVTNATVPLDQTATLTVPAPLKQVATITLGEGVNKASGFTPAAPLRRMACDDPDLDMMNYNPYTSATRTTVWSNTTGTGVAYTGTDSSTSVTVNGRIPAGQTALPSELYIDTVVVTITF